ncbi:MAG: hypothetical protein ACK6D3_17705 [Planctomycetaceae bacterium]|jgi:hypothetical protein
MEVPCLSTLTRHIHAPRWQWLLLIGLWLQGGLLRAQVVADSNDPTSVETPQAIPAFPGAQGFGAETSHARGKRVFFVTSLDDDDLMQMYVKPGRFRRALYEAQKAGGGYVLFKVAGTIRLKREAIIPANTYLAGQSAPGGGISIEGGTLQIGTTRQDPSHDVLLRHIRHRGGFLKKGSDAVQIVGAGTKRVVLDHLSISFFQDGAVDVTQEASDVTVQWCHLGDAADSKTSEPYHGEPHLIAFGGNRVTLHHNFYTHIHSRAPYVVVDEGLVEFSNNLVYNYRKYPTTLDSRRGRMNVVGNVYVAGTNTHAGDPANPNRPPIFGSLGVQVHVADNYALGGLGHDNRNPSTGKTFKGSDQHVERGKPTWVWGLRETARGSDLKLLGTSEGRVGHVPGVVEYVPQRFAELPPVDLMPAPENTLQVLRWFGAWPRDVTDQRLYHEFVTRTGEWRLEPRDDKNEYSGEPQADQDDDGMPDSFEAQHGKDLKPNGHELHPVYDNLEIYLQQRAEELVAAAPPISLTWNDVLKASQPPPGIAPPKSLAVAPPKPREVDKEAEVKPAVPSQSNTESPAPSPVQEGGGSESSWLSLGLLWLAGTIGLLAIVWAGLRGQSPQKNRFLGDTHPVMGKLLLNDNYPEGALVILHPLSPLVTTHPRATVRADGSFEVSTFAEGDGAPAGDYLVSAVWYKPGLKNGKPMISANRLPVRYSQPETSGWSLTVVPGVNELPTWHIQS